MDKQIQDKSLPSFLILISPEQLQAFFKQIQEGEGDKKLNGEEILNIFSTQIFIFKDSSNDRLLLKLFQNFLDLKPEDDQIQLQNTIADKIDEFLKTKQYFRIFDLFKHVVNHFFNQDEIQLKFQNKFGYYSNSTINIKDLNNICDFNSSYKVCVDEKCHFYFQKKYYICEKELINKEVEIYHTDFSNEQYPSFIVHTDLPLERKSIFLPYLPYQTLRIFLEEKQDKLTPIDKFVIIKEIGLGLKELHDHSIFHQNLNSSYIMINNDQDSYISNFVFDVKHEEFLSRHVQSFYYRHPDLIQKAHSFIKTTDFDYEENNIERYTKYDIYSYGILIHEILTSKKIEKFFDGLSHQEKINLLTKGYDYIFKSQKEKYDSKYDIEGICEIVKKCIDIDNPYSSMEEVLNDLDKLPIHQEDEYQTEIENRIKRSTNINTYECTLSDLIVNYYLGNDFSKVLIESLISKVAPNESKNDNDDLISKLLDFLEKFKL